MIYIYIKILWIILLPIHTGCKKPGQQKHSDDTTQEHTHTHEDRCESPWKPVCLYEIGMHLECPYDGPYRVSFRRTQGSERILCVVAQRNSIVLSSRRRKVHHRCLTSRSLEFHDFASSVSYEEQGGQTFDTHSL